MPPKAFKEEFWDAIVAANERDEANSKRVHVGFVVVMIVSQNLRSDIDLMKVRVTNNK